MVTKHSIKYGSGNDYHQIVRESPHFEDANRRIATYESSLGHTKHHPYFKAFFKEKSALVGTKSAVFIFRW